MTKKYKHLLFILLLSIGTSNMWAQIVPQIDKTWTLNTNQSSDSKDYVARESIKLQANGTTSNFSFKAAPGKSFSAKIDAGLLFPPTEGTYQFANGSTSWNPRQDGRQGAAIGSIPGQSAVSPTGAATYNIPIEVPVGINGMQPSLAVNYNNQAGLGTLGIGWELSAVSAITRGGKNLYFDSQNNNVKFDNEDALYMDGQRLIYMSGGTGKFTDGATYATQVENYAKVVFNGLGFIVTNAEGKVMEYGISTDSKLTNANNASDTRIMAWKLNKVTDPWGNAIVYTYSDYGQYLQKIEYAGQSVVFTYNRPLSVIKNSYISDFLLSYTKLLTSITTISGTSTINTWSFDYKSTTDNRLNTVTLTAADNSNVKSTMINWGLENSQIQFSQIGTITDVGLSSQPEGHSSIDFADINGDGYADRIERWIGGNHDGHIIVYFYDGVNKTFGNAQTASIPDIDFYDYDTVHQQFIFTDINNDGKAEIIYTNNGALFAYAYNNTTKTFATCLTSGENGCNTDPAISQYYHEKIVKMIPLDANHDGYTDIMLAYYNKGGSLQTYANGHRGYGVYFGGPNGISPTAATNSVDPNYTLSYLEAGDFNADGKIDLLGLPTSRNDNQQHMDDTNATLVTAGNWDLNDMGGIKEQTLDINGDGLSDLIALGTSNADWKDVWRSSTNTGGIFSPPTLRNEPFTDGNCRFIDLTGDGLVDVLKYENIYNYSLGLNPLYDGYNGEPELIEIQGSYNHTDWIFYKNFGNHFASIPDTITTTTDLSFTNLFTVSDINGDGIADLIITQGSAMYAISMINSNDHNRVASITNGMGQNTAFTYKLFSEYEPYDANEASSKVRNLRSPILVVEKQTDPDGSETNYTFEKPKVHIDGKGFLGFGKVTAINTAKNAKIVSEYGIEPTYFGVNLIKQTISNASDAVVSISKQYNGVKVIDAINKRYIPIVTGQWSFDKLKNTVQKSITDYSAYPNTTKVTTVKDSTTNIVDLTTTVVTTYTGPTGVAPYLPATVTTTRTQGTESDTHSVSYSYTWDTTNIYKLLASTETVDADKGNYKVINETNTHDDFGHLLNVVVKAKDQNGVEQSRGSSMTFTTSGRYIASKTNNLGVVTIYDWNEDKGLLNYETTTIGGKARTTKYSYNGRGDLIETLYPDGNRKTSILQWAVAGCPAGTQYYSYSQTSGSAPLTVYYDNLGREIQKNSYGLNGKKIIVNTEYYTTGTDKGKVHQVSEPHFEGETYNWAGIYSYNPDYGYAQSVITPTGTGITTIDKLKTTVTTPEGTTVSISNAAGQTKSSTKNGKMVSYDYYASGLVKSTTPEGGQAITMVYNPQGKRIKLNDPDGGLIRNEYDAWGELIKEVQLIHMNKDSIITVNKYDSIGRLRTINRNSEITTYIYDSGNKSRVNSIAIANKNSQTFDFDELDRVKSVTETITANGLTKSFVTAKEFDPLGRIKKEIYPSGYYTLNTYDINSNLTEVKDNANRSIWKANTENAMGQAISIFKGSKETQYTYDSSTHQATSIYAAGIINYSYGYSNNKNLQWRKDNLTSQQEDFEYDGMNRLTKWDVTREGIKTYNSMNFDAKGNISQKTDLGDFTMNYGGNRPNGSAIGPHALATITPNPTNTTGLLPNNFSSANLAVTYTDFKKIAALDEGPKHYELTYGVDDQRRMSAYYANGKSQGAATLTRYYVGNYEEEVLANGNVRKIHYLSGAILIQTTGVADSIYYSYADAQGSLIALVRANGKVAERYAYNPWGARRNPDNWALAATPPLGGWGAMLVNRGYTGHEHLDAFGVINMNGRVYDPATASFFSADPALTDAGNWLDYNRYGYCLGNPFLYTDPSGYSWWNENWKPVVTVGAAVVVTVVVSALTLGAGTPTASMLITAGFAGGAAGGFTGGALGTALNGGSFEDCLMAGMKGAIIGGISGAITAGIGNEFSAAGTATSLANEIARAGAHALAQGAFSVVRGGNFWQGAAAGAFSSLAGSAFGAWCPDNIANSAVGITAFSAVVGGAGAYLGGARSPAEILMGVAAGAMVGALNATLHPTNEHKIEAKLKSMKIGETMSGEELGEVLGNPTISLAISEVTRENETTFKIDRTLLVGKSLLKDSPMTIEKVDRTLGNKPVSMYRIKIDYKYLGIAKGCLPEFYINDNKIIFYNKTENKWCYGATK